MASVTHEQFQQDSCTGVATAFTMVSIFIVSLRVYTRTAMLGNFGKDDWAMVSALVFAIGYLAAIYILRNSGMGFTGAAPSLVQMENLIKTTLAIQVMYYVLIFSIKLSILFLYLRFAAEKSFARWIKGTIWLLVVFVIICVVVCVVQCIPIHKMWDITGTVPGHCINTTAFFYFTSSFNIITDIWILLLPIKTLLSIQRPGQEKIALIVVFGLGIFSCIASIVRLHAIRIYTESKDPFYDSVPINMWSQIEVNIGIWCASIPALKALISRGQRERSRAATGYKYHSRDKGESVSKAHSNSRNETLHNAGTLRAHEAFDLDMRGPDGVRRPANVHGDRDGSEDNIFLPGAYYKV